MPSLRVGSRVRRWIAIAVAGLALSVGGLVLAQDKPDDPPKDDAGKDKKDDVPGPDDPDHGGDVDVPMTKRANISPRDMVNKAADYLEKMKDTLRHVVGLQEIARKQKDVIKLNCVNDKLLQVKQLMNIAEAANTNLTEAISRADEDGRYHEFGRITIAEQQVTVLGSEADNCIGEDLSFLGPTEVVVEAPEEPDDPTQPQDPGFPTVDPLPVASPYI